MQDKNVQAGKNAMANGDVAVTASISQRALNWMRRAWRPAASMGAVSLALLLVSPIHGWAWVGLWLLGGVSALWAMRRPAGAAPLIRRSAPPVG